MTNRLAYAHREAPVPIGAGVAARVRRAVRQFSDCSNFAVCISALSLFASQTIAAPNTTSFNDVLELCTHGTNTRIEVSAEFNRKGWVSFNGEVPEAIEKLLADGELSAQYVTPSVRNFAVDKKTAKTPDMEKPLRTLHSTVQRAVFHALWRLDENNASFLILSDGIEKTDHLVCKLYDQSPLGAKTFAAASQNYHEQPGYEQHRGFKPGKYGPVLTLTEYFNGAPPHESSQGLLGFLVKAGWLLEKPMLEPQLGAGASNISIQYFDTDDFRNRYNRDPYASYVLFISRTPPSSEAY